MTSSETSGIGTVVYETTITAVGEQVPAFLEHGILILFSADSPEELHSISVLHTVGVKDSGPHAGDTVHIGETTFPVLAVGHVVEENLLNLGHLDFKSDGRTDPKLPGDVCVPPNTLPTPEVGQVLRILRPGT